MVLACLSAVKLRNFGPIFRQAAGFLFRIYKENDDGEVVFMGQILTNFLSLNISIACNQTKSIHASSRFGPTPLIKCLA